MSETEAAWTRVAGVVYASDAVAADEAYTTWAAKYDDDINKTLCCVANEELAEHSIDHIKSDESALLLDLAAGTGICGEKLLKHGYKGTMDALELNAAMLKKAEEKGLYRKHICCKMSPDEDLPVEQGAYDTATISGALGPNHLEEECILPVVKCLKVGGLMVFNTRNTDANKEYKMRLEKLLNDQVEAEKLAVVTVEEVLHFREKSKETGDVMTATLYIYKKL